MSRVFFLFILFTSAIEASEVCKDTSGPGLASGVPQAYYQEKCLAELSYKNGEFTLAAKHYERASSIRFHEAPNYSLRLEWAESLCRSGKKTTGIRLIESYVLMAKADLGEIACPSDTKEMIKALELEHMHIACQMYGSGLSEQGKMNVIQRLKQVPKIQQVCKNA